MKHVLWLLFLLPLFSYGRVVAATCPNWTDAQWAVLQAAKQHGEEYDLGYTLAAITAQEAFVGPYIVRANGKDGMHGSYGLNQISLEFAMEALGYKNIWEAKQDIIPKLLTDDELSFRLSIRKLQTAKHLPWRAMVAKYNGTGAAADAYAERVANHLKTIQRCL